MLQQVLNTNLLQNLRATGPTPVIQNDVAPLINFNLYEEQILLMFEHDTRYDFTGFEVGNVKDCMMECYNLDCFAFYHVQFPEGTEDQCLVAYNNKDGWRFKSDDLVRFGNVPGAVQFPEEAITATTYLRLFGDDQDEPTAKPNLNFDFYDDKIIPFVDSHSWYDFTGFGVESVKECMNACNELDCGAFYYVQMKGIKEDQCLMAYTSEGFSGRMLTEDDLMPVGNAQIGNQELIYIDPTGAVTLPAEYLAATTYIRNI